MNLTEQQQQAVEHGEAVRVQTETGTIVVVKAEVYDRIIGLLYDEGAPEDAYPAVLEAWDSVGSPDDATDYL